MLPVPGGGGVLFIVLVQMEVKVKGYKGSSPRVRSLRCRSSRRHRTSGGSGRSGRPVGLGRPKNQLCRGRVGRPEGVGRPELRDGPDVWKSSVVRRFGTGVHRSDVRWSRSFVDLVRMLSCWTSGGRRSSVAWESSDVRAWSNVRCV